MALTEQMQRFIRDIEGIEHMSDDLSIRKLSKDFYWFSPILKEELQSCNAELIVRPRCEEDVVRIAAAAARHKVPLTARGAGTGTFGQAVPLAGGAILDMTAMDRLVWQKPGVIRAEAGMLLGDIDDIARPTGWELRIHPSTKRTATLGGFIAGGHAGVGVINYGIMRDRGNILGLKLVTVEETPRVEEVRGDDVETIHHAYGVNGIIVEVELPLAPAYPWQEAIVVFDDFADATRFGLALVDEPGILKKLASAHAWPIPQHFRPLAAYLPKGAHAVLVMIADQSWEAFVALSAEHRGEISYSGREGEGPRGTPLYEYSWGHTTINAYRDERRTTYLACVFEAADAFASIMRIHERFNHEAPLHLEFIRFAGKANAQGIPLFAYESREQVERLTRGYESEGAMIANVHTYFLQNGGMKHIDDAQLATKARNDPHGLLNPGKIAGWKDVAGEVSGGGAHIAAAGWAY